MNKIYLVRCYNDNKEEFIAGCATTKEKADRMVETVKEIFEDDFQYEVITMATNMLLVDDKKVSF